MDSAGVEDKEGVMASHREGGEKDTEVRSGVRTTSDVCVRVLDLGQIEV